MPGAGFQMATKLAVGNPHLACRQLTGRQAAALGQGLRAIADKSRHLRWSLISGSGRPINTV
jgi:hypothetical protein